MSEMTFKPVNIDTLFLCTSANYNVFFVQFDANLVLIPWTISGQSPILYPVKLFPFSNS